MRKGKVSVGNFNLFFIRNTDMILDPNLPVTANVSAPPPLPRSSRSRGNAQPQQHLETRLSHTLYWTRRMKVHRRL